LIRPDAPLDLATDARAHVLEFAVWIISQD
jgi:hypothetical protein